MIGLGSPRWNELRDAYDPAGHIPKILRRLAKGADDAWLSLYDAFALVYRSEISEAAFASVPHIERLANKLALDDTFPHIVFAGRVAYIGLCNCAWMAADVLEPCLRAFAKLNEKAKQLLPHLVENETFKIAVSILAFEQCRRIYDVVYQLEDGEVNVRCPAELCGASLSIKPRGDRLVAVLADVSEADETEDETEDADENVIDLTTIAFDPDGPWTDADALPRLAALASSSGSHPAANHLAHLFGTVACIKCGDRFSILEELLEPSDL